jgi:hypothetical protein
VSSAGDLPESSRGRAYGVPARRQRVLELLSEAYATDQLEQSEFERRIEMAENAGTVEALDELVADFPPEIAHGAVTPAEYGIATRPSGTELQREIDRLDGMDAPTRFTVLGDQHLEIKPGDPRLVRSVSVIGDCVVDLRELAGAGGVVLVKVAALLGDTRIIVPRGTPVDVRLFNLIGDEKRTKLRGGLMRRLARRFGVDESADESVPDAPGPTIVVTGVRLIGDTEIVEQ